MMMQKSSSSLKKMIIKTAKKLDIAPTTVVVTGGLINAQKFWGQSLEELYEEVMKYENK